MWVHQNRFQFGTRFSCVSIQFGMWAHRSKVLIWYLRSCVSIQFGMWNDQSVLSIVDKTEHNTQKEIAEELGWSRNLTDGWKFELAQVRKEILLKQGRENMSDGKKYGLSTIDKPLHNTRKEIAEELGWSTGKVAMADKVWK